jgi:hypothetical protein
MNIEEENKEAVTDDILSMISEILPQELKPKTNRSMASAVRENESKLIAAGVRPVDLSQIPIEERGQYNYLSVTVPESIASYLNACEFPMSQDERNALEIEMEKYHGVSDPCYIQMSSHFQETGRRYEFLEAREEYDSGFTYHHEMT